MPSADPPPPDETVTLPPPLPPRDPATAVTLAEDQRRPRRGARAVGDYELLDEIARGAWASSSGPGSGRPTGSSPSR